MPAEVCESSVELHAQAAARGASVDYPNELKQIAEIEYAIEAVESVNPYLPAPIVSPATGKQWSKAGALSC